MARMQAGRPVAAGSPMSNCRNDGLACTHRRAFIRLDMMASTPPEPGGTCAAASSMTTYGSTPRARAAATSPSQNASRNQRMLMPQ